MLQQWESTPRGARHTLTRSHRTWPNEKAQPGAGLMYGGLLAWLDVQVAKR